MNDGRGWEMVDERLGVWASSTSFPPFPSPPQSNQRLSQIAPTSGLFDGQSSVPAFGEFSFASLHPCREGAETQEADSLTSSSLLLSELPSCPPRLPFSSSFPRTTLHPSRDLSTRPLVLRRSHPRQRFPRLALLPRARIGLLLSRSSVPGIGQLQRFSDVTCKYLCSLSALVTSFAEPSRLLPFQNYPPRA